ncbi:MAG: YegP family protein [Rhodospirillales bacterium]
MHAESMRFQVIVAADGTWHWRLLSEGGTPIARSVQGHGSEAQCLYEIALVMSSAQGVIERVVPEARRPADPLHERSNARPV